MERDEKYGYLPPPPQSFSYSEVAIPIWNYNAKEKKYLPTHYLPAKKREMWFREVCPSGQIVTEVILLDLDKEYTVPEMKYDEQKKRTMPTGNTKTAPGIAIFRATVTDDKGNVATGTKMECRVVFDDYVEKAETGAVARALAKLGYGESEEAPEITDEAYRPADTPTAITRNNNGKRAPQQRPQPAPAAPKAADTDLATEKQVQRIVELRTALEKPIEALPEGLTVAGAREILNPLQEEYRMKRRPLANQPIAS